MNYKCARAIKVERLENGDIRKTFADFDRKGLTAQQWQTEMQHELHCLDIARDYVNCPIVIDESNHWFDMSYCGESIKQLTIPNLITIKNMERDLILYGNLYHNDIKPENILYKDNQFYFIDFGRATFDAPGFPFYTHADLFLKNDGMLRKINACIDDVISVTNAHGGHISYYGLDGKIGIRDWKPRWKVLKGITDFKNKRILDLGCNQGLFTTSIAEEFSPRFVLGVDASSDIVEAANLYAISKNAISYFMQLNICEGDKRNPHFVAQKSWQDEVGYNWDIVSALSLYHWVKNKQELLEFLGNFACIIMELHDDNELIEVSNYFGHNRYKMIIVNAGSSEFYDRPIVKFIKQG